MSFMEKDTLPQPFEHGSALVELRQRVLELEKLKTQMLSSHEKLETQFKKKMDDVYNLTLQKVNTPIFLQLPLVGKIVSCFNLIRNVIKHFKK